MMSVLLASGCAQEPAADDDDDSSGGWPADDDTTDDDTADDDSGTDDDDTEGLALFLDQPPLPPGEGSYWGADLDCDVWNTPSQSLADNFEVTDPALPPITAAVIWTYYMLDNAPTAEDDWSVIFHENVPGSGGDYPVPGLIVEAFRGVPSSREMTAAAPVDGLDEYRVVLHLGDGVTLAPGTYWVEVFNHTAGSDQCSTLIMGPNSSTPPSLDTSANTQTPGEEWGWYSAGPFIHNVAIQLWTES